MELHLGDLLDQEDKTPLESFRLPAQDLLTHMFICGVTGSGKTVLGKAVIEEAALMGIPSIVIDLKGDLSSLGLVFPSADPEDFVPWVEVARDRDPAQEAKRVADEYQTNLQMHSLMLMCQLSLSTRSCLHQPNPKWP